VREALLRQAASAGDVGAPLQAPWPVIADMLGALDTLAADESTVTAALLFDLPGLRAAVLPMLPQHRDAIAGLLDGQDAADGVGAACRARSRAQQRRPAPLAAVHRPRPARGTHPAGTAVGPLARGHAPARQPGTARWPS
jgi:hypothetical protein